MRMEEDHSPSSERILNLTLQIIYLLTGERFGPLKRGDQVIITLPPANPRTPEKNSIEKILKVTNQIAELLTGEVPIRCQDVSVYFSMEEWEYVEGHKDLYKDIVMMEDQPPLTSPDKYDVRKPSEKDMSSSHKNLIFHKKIYAGVRPYLCSECGKCFITKSHLARHLSQHPAPRLFSCPECHKTFIGKGDLVRHLRYHNCERPFLCTECGQSFIRKGHLSRHLRTHTGEKPFLCSECGKCFSWKDTLLKHQRIHMRKKEDELVVHQETQADESSECGNSFKSESGEHPNDDMAEKSCFFSDTLEGAIKNADVKQEEILSSEEEAALEPSEQVKMLSKKESPDVKVETRGKPYACSECGKFYSRKKYLIIHQRTHTGELPFKCLECGKRFNEKRYLRIHQSTHTGERAFSCSECGKGFSWKESLIRHKKFHSGVRPHSCPDCGKSFTLKGDLLRHQRTHKEKRLHSCSECGESFHLEKYLLQHQKSHAGAGPFSCSDCGKYFSRRDSLYRHVRSHFGEP